MRLITRTSATVAAIALSASVALAQAPPPGAPLPGPQAFPAMAAPPAYPPAELDRIVSPIALYPDPLLAQVLAAATFSPDIPAAAQWSDQHHYLNGPTLTAAMAADRLPWDPAVQAMLPFPSVLGMMASNIPWTEELGAAFLAQQPQVMDAVQRMRHLAAQYGYLHSNASFVVQPGPYIAIVPANPVFIPVPYYNPAVVFVAPVRGVVVGTAVGFSFGVTIGHEFAPWGWGATHVVWTNHVVVVNNATWGRTWVNRAVYVHPYSVPRYAVERRAVEQHKAIERSTAEKEADRRGQVHKEEHKDDRKHDGGR